MNPKITTLATLLLISLFSDRLSAQQTIRMNAIKANDYGVAYSLPKTSIAVTLKIKKATYTKGEFFQFSQQYLNLEPVTENRTEYTLEEIHVSNRGIPDKANSFMVVFQPKTAAPYLTLTEDGLICAINADAELSERPKINLPESISTSYTNPRQFLSQETLMAGSTAKQAELVSKQIFDLRRSKNDILTGEAENMPPDGEAYRLVIAKIDEQERALTEMFSGKTNVEYFTKEIVVVPATENIERKIIARFSEKLGPVDAENLAGAPIYLTLRNKATQPVAELSEKERQNLEKKLLSGIVYNIPGKAQLTLEYKNKTPFDKEIDVVQYGSQDVLAKKMFDNMKHPVKVIFYPNLGAIKQIIQ